MTAKYALWTNQYIAVHFFHGFLPYMVSYAKFILMADGVNFRLVNLVLLFYEESIALT